MPELAVYFARAMDARRRDDVLRDDDMYARLLTPIDAVVVNRYDQAATDVREESPRLVERDLAMLKASDVLLADLSLRGYRYVGCIFEIVHAAMNNIPVIAVVGENDFAERVYFQAYCDFIAKNPGDAVEYLWRVCSPKGLAQSMSEMKAYYEEVAADYSWLSPAPQTQNQADVESFSEERRQLRAIISKYVNGLACEVGVGTGDWTRTICETADEVVGVEVSEAMLVQARVNLSRYGNLRLLNCDVLAEPIRGGPFDCVVIYFLLSLLPDAMRDRLFDVLTGLLKPGGLLLVADTKRILHSPALGLGRRQLQRRTANDKTFILFKDHFAGNTLVKLLEGKGYHTVDSSRESCWFSWAVSRRPA